MKINIEKQLNGSLLLFTIIDNEYFKKVYYYFSLNNAKQDFKKFVKNELEKNFYNQKKI